MPARPPVKRPAPVYHPFPSRRRKPLAKHFPETARFHPVQQHTNLVIAGYCLHLEQRFPVVSPLLILHRPLKIQYRRMLKEKYRKPVLYPLLDLIILMVSKPPAIGRLHTHPLKAVQQLVK
jgi:hypothetical protein